MYRRLTTSYLDESTDFLSSEESDAEGTPPSYFIPEWMLEGLLRDTAIHINESTDFLSSEESDAEGTPPSYLTLEDLEKITKQFEKLLAIKESEIRKLSIELSQIKKEDLQQNRESEQIKNQYREEITKIPEAQQAMCT